MNRHWDVFALSRLFSGLKRLNMTSPPCLICYRCEGELLDFFFHFFFKFGFKGRLRLRAHIWGNCCVYISLARFLPPPTPPPLHTLLCASQKRDCFTSPPWTFTDLFFFPFLLPRSLAFCGTPAATACESKFTFAFPPHTHPQKNCGVLFSWDGRKKKIHQKKKYLRCKQEGFNKQLIKINQSHCGTLCSPHPPPLAVHFSDSRNAFLLTASM